MIFSKQALKVVNITQKDKSVPLIDNVVFCKNGIIAAACRSAVIVVSAVPIELREKLNFDELDLKKDIMLSSDNVKKIINLIPHDKTFKGLLEFVDISLDNVNDKLVKISWNDGSQEHKLKLNRVHSEIIPFKKIIKKGMLALDKKRYRAIDARIRVNLSRFRSILDVIEKIAGDSSGELPIYQTIALSESVPVERQLILRTLSPKTNQEILAVSGLVGFSPENDWIKRGKLENYFLK